MKYIVLSLLVVLSVGLCLGQSTFSLFLGSNQVLNIPTSVVNAWTTQIAGDMFVGSTSTLATNEGHPHGIDSSWDFYSSAVLWDGNNPYNSEPTGANAVNYWGTVYVDSAGNPATNTRVNIRNCRLTWKRTSTGVWTTWGPDVYPGDVDDYPEDFQGNSTATNVRTETDGSMSVKPATGKTSHWYGPYPRVAIAKDDMGGVVVACEVRLIKDNAGGTDDRASAKYLVNVGADYNPAVEGDGIDNNPSVGGSKFVYATSAWRSVTMTTLTLPQLNANPPPIDLTGDNP